MAAEASLFGRIGLSARYGTHGAKAAILGSEVFRPKNALAKAIRLIPVGGDIKSRSGGEAKARIFVAAGADGGPIDGPSVADPAISYDRRHGCRRSPKADRRTGAHESPSDMIIGTIGSSRRAHVRGGGIVVLHAGTAEEITIDWWIGGDDRWYRPDSEITTRQHLIRNAPIVQTSVRVPAGDAIMTTFGAVQGQRELAVCDVENRSKVPFALALVFRGPGVRNVSAAGPVVRIDGFPLITLPRAPQRFALVEHGGDLAGMVMSGLAVPSLDRLDPSVGVELAVILPVAHGTTLRFAALLGAASGVALTGTPVLTLLPDVHRAASGWGAHVRRLPEFRVPDKDFNSESAANGAALLLAAEPAIASLMLTVSERAMLATALAVNGCTAESGALLEDIGEIQLNNGSFETDSALISAHMIRAVATHAVLSRDHLFAESLAPNLAGALEFLLKRCARLKNTESAAILPEAARFFDVVKDTAAAGQCRKAWINAGSPRRLPVLPLPPLPAVGPGGSLVPDDPTRLASAVVSQIRAMGEIGPDDRVDLLAGFRKAWLGANLDVRKLATPAGRLSFSLRWHGSRPALLWDVEEPTGVALELRCSAIDPMWRGEGSKGEALLQAPTLA